jgi:hypothetical protein
VCLEEEFIPPPEQTEEAKETKDDKHKKGKA